MKTWERILDTSLNVIAATMTLLLLLTGCTALAPKPTESYTQGIYEFTFAVEQTAGEPTDAWEFLYTYNGASITSGHQILFSLEIFTFHSIQVDVIEKGTPGNIYSAAFRIAICNGASGKTEVTVVASDGKTATFKITCQLTQIGKQ